MQRSPHQMYVKPYYNVRFICSKYARNMWYNSNVYLSQNNCPVSYMSMHQAGIRLKLFSGEVTIRDPLSQAEIIKEGEEVESKTK